MPVDGGVSDGLEAVQKATELKSDLILLDIGVLRLNGIEATRKIRKLFSEPKIIFLTQKPSADVLREVLNAGAQGHFVKINAGGELLTSVEAVLLGKTFVSSSMGKR
jgi:DNA-binding NarL/FixJ family response regulator